MVINHRNNRFLYDSSSKYKIIISPGCPAPGVLSASHCSSRLKRRPHCSMLPRVFTRAVARKQTPSVPAQRRQYGLYGISSYFSSYIPPTGVLETPQQPDQTPFDHDHRPRRHKAQIMVRVAKSMRENDFYTITKKRERHIRPPRPVFVPEARSTWLYFFASGGSLQFVPWSRCRGNPACTIFPSATPIFKVVSFWYFS